MKVSECTGAFGKLKMGWSKTSYCRLAAWANDEPQVEHRCTCSDSIGTALLVDIVVFEDGVHGSVCDVWAVEAPRGDDRGHGSLCGVCIVEAASDDDMKHESMCAAWTVEAT